MAGRLAFVPPRFGPQVVGGSEAVMREMALGLARRGWEVEVLTTCAVDHYTWLNALPAGRFEEDGVIVHRFPTEKGATRAGRRAQNLIEAGRLPNLDEQLTWIGFQLRVPELFAHLLSHGDDFDAVVFSPYLFWTTAVCLDSVVERAVVMPCLHDEEYARLEIFRPVLATPASLWFLSEPEHELAHRLGPLAARHVVTGAGLPVPERYDPDGFRRRFGIERPFVLYAGRRETGKGWSWLLHAFTESIAPAVDVDLVTIGVGKVDSSRYPSRQVIDLGFLSDDDRNDAFAAALAYVQPSRMESFSRTAMEAWLAGTPVLATAAGEVVAWHCRRSGGGQTFADQRELVGQVRRLLEDPSAAQAMAARGRSYVLENYRWEVVLDRMEAALKEMP